MDLTTLRSILQATMTREDCYRVAVIAGLNAQSIQEIRDSRDSVNLLIDKLRDSGRIRGTDIQVLTFALDTLHLSQVVNQIEGTDDHHIPGTASEIETAAADSRSTCICGQNLFEELTLSDEYESRTVILRCSRCSAEWFPPTMTIGTTPARNLYLRWNIDIFSYNYGTGPLNLAELENEHVTDVSQLRRGDQIIFRRCWGVYDHHAILVGVDSDKLEVIEWTSRWMYLKLFASICLGNVNFPRGGLRRRIYENNDHADVVIARAFDMMNNSTEEYNLFTNNCETLATYCKVGKRISIQGQQFQDILPQRVQNIVLDVVRGFRGLLTIKNVSSLLVLLIAYFTVNYW